MVIFLFFFSPFHFSPLPLFGRKLLSLKQPPFSISSGKGREKGEKRLLTYDIVY